MITNYTDCVNYFRFLSLRDPEIRDFFVGEDKRILEASRSDIKYPVLWLEYADGKFWDPAGTGVIYDCKLYVIENSELGDTAGQEQSLEIGEGIIKRLLFRMRDNKNIPVLISKSKWMRVKMAQVDNAYGWELSVQVSGVLSLNCIPPEENSGAAIVKLLPAEPGAGDLTILINGEMFSTTWTGAEDEMGGVVNQLAEKINISTNIQAWAAGAFLSIKHKTPGTVLTISWISSDFAFELLFPELFTGSII